MAPTDTAPTGHPSRTGPPTPGAVPSPPLALPGAHLAAALVFFAAGTAGLAWNAELLAGGVFLAPRLEASVHLLTLGWISTTIFGALYQFLPVALERPVASIPAAWVTLACHVPGLTGFVAWLWTGADGLLIPSALALTIGLLTFCGNLALTLVRARTRDVTWAALALATVFLLATVGLGVTLALNLRHDLLGPSRTAVLAIHLHLALAGWVGLVVVGVGQRLLPMFLLSPAGGTLPAQAAVAFLGAGCALLASLHHAVPAGLWPAAAGLLLLGGLAWAWQVAGFLRRRVRRRLDPGMGLAAAGAALLVPAILLGFPLAAGTVRIPLMITQTTLLVLGFSLFVAGHQYKILPFLVWYHRHARRPGRGGVQRVAELYSAPVARTAVAGQISGALLLAVGVAAAAPAPATLGAALLAAGAWIQAVQLLLLLRPHGSPS